MPNLFGIAFTHVVIGRKTGPDGAQNPQYPSNRQNQLSPTHGISSSSKQMRTGKKTEKRTIVNFLKQEPADGQAQYTRTSVHAIRMACMDNSYPSGSSKKAGRTRRRVLYNRPCFKDITHPLNSIDELKTLA
jgi:hypothetical protein